MTIDSEYEVVNISVFRDREVFLGGVQLLDRNICELKNELSMSGFVFEDFNGGLWSEALQIVLVEVDGKVDGVEMERKESKGTAGQGSAEKGTDC